MWNLYIIFGILYFGCGPYTAALNESFRPRYKRSESVNLLSGPSPPKSIKELEHGRKFFSDKLIRLNCEIDSTPRPTFQWYVSTSEVIDMSSNMQELQFEKVPNANDHILEIDGKRSNKKFFKYAYYCLTQNPLGILLSNKVIVEKVSRPNSIKIKYTTYHVYEGEKFVIQCNTVPDLWSGLFKFKTWEVQLKSDKILYLSKSEGRYSVITTTKTPQLHIRNVTKEDFEGTKVRCVFQSIVDSEYVTDIDFKQVEKLPYEAPPYLSNNCGSSETITVNMNTNVELPWCSIPKTLNVTWFKIDNNNNEIEIGTDPNDLKYRMVSKRYGNLLIINTTKDDSGKYTVKTTGKLKEKKLSYTLNVYEPATITLTPLNIQKELLEKAEFSCSASYSKVQFYWLHNGRKVTSGYDDGNIEISNMNQKSILTVEKTRLSVIGIYQCIAVAENELKSISEYRQTSTSLLLSKVPPFLYQQSPRVEKGTATALVQMSNTIKQKSIVCVFAAKPRPNIDWYLDSKKIPIKVLFEMRVHDDPNSIYNFIANLTINLDELTFGDDIRKYAGEYQAVATNSWGTASCKTFVLMDGHLELRLPSEQIAVGGKDHILSCHFVAMGVPEFSWNRKTETGVWEPMPSNHRTIMTDKNYKLLLKNVIKAEDEGIYRCTAKFNKETKVANTSLEIANPPNLQQLPPKQEISESNYHICTVNNKADKPWYVWWSFTKYKSNETKVINPDLHNSLYSDFSVKYDSVSNYEIYKNIADIPLFLNQYPNKGVNLRIKERSYDKSALGKFTCHAKNHIGSAEMSIEDNFLTLAFEIVPPSTSEVIVGNDLYLNCTPKKSDLDPITKWKLSNGDKFVEINDMNVQYEGRIYQYSNGTFVMKNVKETDPSRMFCFIIPSKKNFDVQSKVAYIDIRVPARVQTMAKEIHQVEGSSFNLSCNVYGHTQNLSVTWLNRTNPDFQWGVLYEACIYSRDNNCIYPYTHNSRNFNPIIQSLNITYHTVSLEFRNAIKSISGEYKCKAKNKFNKQFDETSTYLTIISKPGKVYIDTEQKSSTSNDIEVHWKAPSNDGNRPILGYIIKYCEIQPNSNNQEKKNITQKVIKVNNTVFFKKIDNLRPYRKYEVSISAENEVGISEDNLISVTTQEAQPEKPVRGLKASSTQPHEILITWSDPEPQFLNGKILNYQLCYQIMQTGEESESVHVSALNWLFIADESNPNSKVICQNTTKPTLTVSYLTQFTDFGIRVIAFNTKGPSPPAFTKVRTLEDLPQAPPTDLNCRAQQHTIQLSWNPPGRQTINGVLKGYVVYYYKPNKYGDESDMKSITVQGTTAVTLHQLEPYTGYLIQVMAANRKGLGPASARILCTTTQAKPEAPDVVKAVKVNNTCMAVSWLHSLRPHGKIIEYCVTDAEYSPDKTKCQAPDFTKRYNYMLICDPLFQYLKFKVFARNNYDGAAKEAMSYKEDYGIISIGGQISGNEGSSVTLLCETSKIDDNIYVIWKKDNRQIFNNESNLKIFPNNSLEVKLLEKYGHHSYSCSTESDSIEYNLNVIESSDGLPRAPIINEVKVTENSIFISWKSKGTTDITAQIISFSLSWTNLYNGESKVVSIDGNTRTFYLNNVTCASEFHLKIKSINVIGSSEFSDILKLTTLGSVPQAANSAILLKKIESNSVEFNLNAFGAGDNCSAMYFKIEMSLTSMGPDIFQDILSNKNLTIYDLENKCCYKITALNPLTSYKYRITAYNPAGSNFIYNTFKTGAVNDGYPPNIRIAGSKEESHNSWLLMIILIIAVVFIMVFLVLGVLYIIRNKDRRAQPTANIPKTRKPDLNHARMERTVAHDDTTSMDSNGEPSPYAVYQPDSDPKNSHIWNQQISQTSSTPGYNYPDHHYNQIKYDKIHQNTRPHMPENQGEFIRRVNSAECLSSLGNASISGIADLESPSNIEPNDNSNHGQFSRISNIDDVFNNIPFPGCSTVNRSMKRVRRESENIRYREEERIRLFNQNPNMVLNWRNDPTYVRGPQQSVKPVNPNSRVQYRQQMSVPEPMSIYGQQYGYPSNRIRSQSGVGSSQSTIPNNHSQKPNYGNYYETHRSQNAYPNAKRDNPASVINPSIEPYSKYVPTNHLSNYASQPRDNVVRPEFTAANGNVPRPSRNESSDDEIYTDRVILV